MRPSALALALVLASGAVGAGCHRNALRPERAYAQVVTPEGGGRFWVTGSEGFAAYYDGQRLLRRDYPGRAGAFEGAYEMSSDVPVARVVRFADATWLFTRPGDVLRWEPSGWQPVSVRFPPTSAMYPDEVPQIDAALVAPDGRLVVQLHPSVLAWADANGLRQGRFEREDAPSYFTWLGVIDGVLYGLGWAANGSDRATFRRGADGRWEQLDVLGPEPPGEHFTALVPDGRGEIVAVGSRGLVRRVGPQGSEGVVAAARIPLRALPGSNTVPPADAVAYLFGGVVLGPRSAALFAGGHGNTVIELGPEYNYLHGCSADTALFIGALPIAGGLRLVTNQAAVMDSTREGCTRRAPPSVNH